MPKARLCRTLWSGTKLSIFPKNCARNLAELGLLGVLFPEEYGGAGMGYVEYATIIEELGRVDGSVGLSVAAHNSLCSNHIFMFGTEEQKQKYLVPLAQGRKFRRVGFDRSKRRFGCERNADKRRQRKRSLDGQRLEKFHHSRDLLQHLRRGCCNR